MPKTKYTGVYLDANGKFFYQTELGVDKATGERIQCKSRKDQLGQPFATAYAAHKELRPISRIIARLLRIVRGTLGNQP